MKKGLLCIFPCLVSVRGVVQITLWRAWISQRVFHDFWWDLEQQQEEEVFLKWEIALRETLSEVMFLIPGMVVRPPTSWTGLVRKEGRVGDQMGEREKNAGLEHGREGEEGGE